MSHIDLTLVLERVILPRCLNKECSYVDILKSCKIVTLETKSLKISPFYLQATAGDLWLQVELTRNKNL